MQYSSGSMAGQACSTAPEQHMPSQLPQLPAPPALCRDGSSQLSSEAKGKLLDIVGIQSSIQIFNAKYPSSNVVCGMQVGDAPELQWQCFGADAGRPEVQSMLNDFVNEEVRYQRGLRLDGDALASSGLPRSGARYRSLRAFVDAAAVAGIVAGVQVSMLLDLASKMCSAGPEPPTPSQPPAEASAAPSTAFTRTNGSYQCDLDAPAAATSADREALLLDDATAAVAASMPPPLLQPLLQPLQPVASHATATTSCTLLRLLQQSFAQHPSTLNLMSATEPLALDTLPSNNSTALHNASIADGAGGVGAAARGGRKPRFTREQHAAIMESVERNYAQHPSRYTELVIREMKERFPELELASASVRKLKFRANEANKGDCNADNSARDNAAVREAAAAAAAREAVKSLVGLRNCGQQQQQQQDEQEQQQEQLQQQGQKGLLAAEHAAAAAPHQQPDAPPAYSPARAQAGAPASGLLQCLEAAEQLDAAAAATATAAPIAAATASGLSAAVGAKRGRSEPPEAAATSSVGGRGGAGSAYSGSKRQRMTAEQMASLVDCVKRHVESCPERYSQLVIADMKAAYPDLELNMGQIRKIKFRTLGNARKAGDDLDSHLNLSDTEDEARPARQGNGYGLHEGGMGSYGGSFDADGRGSGGAFGCT